MKLSNLNNYFHSIDVQVSLELAYTEDEIYELSLAREPRDSLSVNIYFRHSSNSSKCLIIIFFTAAIFTYQAIITGRMANGRTN